LRKAFETSARKTIGFAIERQTAYAGSYDFKVQDLWENGMANPDKKLGETETIAENQDLLQ
jgi:hypothetical protein